MICKIKFEKIGEGKWQARFNGTRISSAVIIGAAGSWQLQGQRSADTIAIFKTRMEAARYQLHCVHAEKQFV